MEHQQTVTLTRAGRRYRLVPVRSTTTKTEKTVTETKKTSVRNVKIVTTSRRGGQNIVSVDKKVITTSSTTEALLVMRSVPKGSYAVTGGSNHEAIEDTDREQLLGDDDSKNKSELKVEKDARCDHHDTSQNVATSSHRVPFYTIRQYDTSDPDYQKQPAYSLSCNSDTAEYKTHAKCAKTCDPSPERGNGICESKTTNELATEAKNAPKETTSSLFVASSSPSRNSSGDSDYHKNDAQHTSEMIARHTKGESAYVRPGLVGNRFADLQPIKCVGSADVMEQTSAADSTGAKRPFLDMRSIWDIGQLIVATKSPRKPITCYRDYIS